MSEYSAESRTTIHVDLLINGRLDVFANALLVIEDGTIVDCCAVGSHRADLRWERTAIVPPLVNAHTHLEFSNLASPISAHRGFAVWLDDVIKLRTLRVNSDREDLASVTTGADESIRCGCRWMGEIATSEAMPDPRLAGYQFLELLAASPDQAPAILQRAQRFLQHRQQNSNGLRAALSPHAPYSTSMELVEGAVTLANRFEVPVAMHLAETAEEMELLGSQTGPLADFLQRRGIWPPPHITRPTEIAAYLQLLAEAPRSLVVHGNYLSKDDWSFIAERPRMSVVYCPRTHAHFDHPKYPLLRGLDSGVRVVLGTDSRASNPDLSVWAEAQFVAERYPELRSERILAMVTTDAAAALGCQIAQLAVGQAADFSVISGLPVGDSSDAFGRLLSSATFPSDVWYRGRSLVAAS